MRNNEKKKISRISIALVLIAILILMEVIILHNNAVKVTAIEELNSKMQESGSNMHEVEFSTIATDYNHSIAIDKNGNLWGWGYHSIYSYEQIETTDYPVKLEIQGEFKEVSMSSTHRLAIDNNGNIWSWGDNTYGELGDGSTNSKNINEAIMLESDVKFKEVLAGSNYSLAIDEAGNLWAWGYNRSGQLGDGTNTNSYEPKQIKQDTQFNKIASAYNVSLAIDKAGNLWTWGDGTKEPNKIETSTKFKEISANEDHKLAIDTLGNIWAWGTNEYAQLGDGTTTSSVNPKKITSNTKFNKISAGFLYSLAIDETGNLWAWGNNSIGQLGDGTTTKVTKPKQVTTDKKFVNVQAGHGSIDTEICNLALDENGKIWSWGKNTYGQLGNAQASIYSTEMLLLNTISHYTKIDTGAYSHNLAIDKEGNLWAWGDNTYGQLGDRTTTNSDIPKQIMVGTKFKEIAAGEFYSLAIDTAGNLWAWGDNRDGQLGDETKTNSTEPKQISKGTKFTKVITGRYSSFAIDEAENLWGWGLNDNGQIGIGKDSNSGDHEILKPTKINEGVKYKEVAADANQTLAIDKAGNIWAWGESVNPTASSIVRSNIPINLNLELKLETLSNGENTRVAIDINGNLWKWENYDSENKMPTQLTNGTKFKKVSAGIYVGTDGVSYMALDEEGNIWTWGGNGIGQLGNGTTTNVDTPTKIENTTPITDISMGGGYALALDEEGNLWAWGNNSYLNSKYKLLGNPAFGNLSTAQVTQFSKDTKFVYENGENFIDEEGNLWYGSRKINIPSNEIKYSKASNHLILDQEGNLYAKGRNNYGQLGDGTNTDSDELKPIMSGRKFKEISDSEYHSLAIDQEGNLWAWGHNNCGQLGDGTNTDSNVPKLIKSNTKFDKIYASDDASLAIDTLGNLWAWGDNYSGELGDGTTRTKYNEPKQIMVGTKFKEIYISDNDYSLMIDTSGNLWGTGSLNSGSVKDETTKSTSTPIQILSGTKFNKVNGLMALDVDGKIWTSMVMNGGGNSQATSVSKRIENDVTLVDINIANGRSAIDNNGGLWLWGYLPTILYRQENYTEPQKITVMDYSYEVKFMDGTKTLKTQYVSEGKSATAPEVTPKEGYKFIGWDKPFDNITSDLIVNAIWERNTFTVTFKDGTERTDTQTVNSGESATPPNWTKPGYDLSWSEDITNITSDLTVNAIWTARADTPYKVIHHFRSLDTEVEGYIEEEEPKTGTTDTVTYELNGGTPNGTLTSKYTYGKEMILQTNRVTKEGYEFAGWYDNEELTGNPVTSIPATSTGDKTFYAKWIKNIFTVTFKDREERTDVQTINRGQNATAPNWTRAGYTLTWDTEFTNVTSDLTVNAIWTARSDTPYKVIHHFRNLDTEVEGYIDEEEAKTGTTDTVVTAEYKTREGFTKNENHPNKVETGTVTGDGSLILHLYYNRNTYNITYELNGGTQSSPLTNKYVYGKEMILQTNRVTKEGYTFAGWYDNEELEGSPVASISATSTGNKTFYAKWVEAEKEYYILSEIYNIDLTENTITKVSPETMSAEFLSKIDTNGQMKVVNARGEEITDTSLVGTGYKLQVTFKGEVHTYEIAVRGDLDGNGKITTTDLSIINQQILHKIELTGIRAKAADTDYNGRLTTTDLSMINQAVLRKIKL